MPSTSSTSAVVTTTVAALAALGVGTLATYFVLRRCRRAPRRVERHHDKPPAAGQPRYAPPSTTSASASPARHPEIVAGAKFKADATALFAAKDFEGAIGAYGYSLGAYAAAAADPLLSASDLAECKEQNAIIRANIVLMHLKLGSHGQAIEAATSLLQEVDERASAAVGASSSARASSSSSMSPQLRVKVLLRRGAAYREMRHLAAARADFEEALATSGGSNEEAQRELQSLQTAEAAAIAEEADEAIAARRTVAAH